MPSHDSTASVLEAPIAPPKPTVEQMIVIKAKEYGVSPATALRIAKCESGFNPTIKNASSSATGVFQFIISTWVNVAEARDQDYTLEDRKDPEKNIDNAMWLASQEGWGHWECK